MLVHSVYFWLQSSLDKQQVTEFANALEGLKSINSAEAVYVGTPSTAVADRPVIEKGYNYALTVVFKDIESHNAYQVDPVHVAFLETYKPMFEKVVVYDAD